MNKGLLQIAEGFAMVADGYRKMASEGMEILKDAQTEEKPENQVHRRKDFYYRGQGCYGRKIPCRKNAGNQTVIERVRCR